MANLVIEAIQSVVPLRRCTAKLGKRYVAPPNAPVCTAAQLGVAECPCSGTADAARYGEAVEMVRRGLGGEPDVLLAPLRERMLTLARNHRFEEAASVRDRAQALAGAIKRQRMMDNLRQAGEFEIAIGDIAFHVDQGRLLDSRIEGTLSLGLALPPPPPSPPGSPLSRDASDETLCIARYLEANSQRVRLLRCSGEWSHPVAPVPSFEPRAGDRKAAA
jgi:DNA polymerase-3 subunit epsilon